MENPHEPVGIGTHGFESLIFPIEFFLFLFFRRVGAGNADTGNGGFNVCVDFCDLLAVAFERRVHASAHFDRKKDDERHNGENNQRQRQRDGGKNEK